MEPYSLCTLVYLGEFAERGEILWGEDLWEELLEHHGFCH